MEVEFCSSMLRHLTARPAILSIDHPLDPRSFKTRVPRLVPAYPREKLRPTSTVSLVPLKRTSGVTPTTIPALGPDTTIAELKRRYATLLNFTTPSAVDEAVKHIKILNRHSPLKDNSTIRDLRKVYGGGKLELGVMIMPGLNSVSKGEREAPERVSSESKEVVPTPATSVPPTQPAHNLQNSPAFWEEVTNVVLKWVDNDSREASAIVSKFKDAL